MRFSHPAPGPQAPSGEHARYLAENGLPLVHTPRGQKGPTYKAWQKNPITDPQAAFSHWSRHPSDGIGVVLGPAGLCSLDVDDLERARLALGAVGIDLDELLDDPSIPRVEGNPQKARLLFHAPAGDPLQVRKLSLPGLNGKPRTIFELRAGPVQDLLPPSWHPTGKSYRWLRAPWEVAEVPEPSAALLDLWRRWDELLPLLLVALDPEAGQGQVERATSKYRAQQGQGNGDARWDEVRRQIRERLSVADLLTRMGAQERGRGKYSCPFHPPDPTPSFCLYTDLWVCFHGEAPVGWDNSKGQSVGDVVDLYQYWKGLESPGKATVELARELGIALPTETPISQLSAASKLPLENWKTEFPKSASLSGELSSAPIGGQEQKTTRWTRQTVAALRTTYKPVA